MKNFLKILGISLALFFSIIYVEERESLIYPFLRTTPTVSEKPIKEVKDEFKDIIIKYNNSLVEAYERGDGNLVQNMEKAIKQETVMEVFFTHQNSPDFKPQLADIKFLTLTVSGDVFTIRTKEEWRIPYRDTVTNEIRFKQDIYNVAYRIKMIERKWRIIDFESKRDVARSIFLGR